MKVASNHKVTTDFFICDSDERTVFYFGFQAHIYRPLPQFQLQFKEVISVTRRFEGGLGYEESSFYHRNKIFKYLSALDYILSIPESQRQK